MRNKISVRPVSGFLAGFVLIFGLLIAPWPGWDGHYAEFFRAVGQWAFTQDGEQREVVFSPNPEANTLDTRLTLANRALLDESGRGPLMRTAIDTRSIGWVPTALVLALIAASPVPWQRRLLAMPIGLFLIHAFIYFTLLTWIWNNSPGVSLLTLSPLGKTVADNLNYACMTQLGISFTVPVLIWIVVTFKRQDVLSA